jgi:hypothetical protein
MMGSALDSLIRVIGSGMMRYLYVAFLPAFMLLASNSHAVNAHPDIRAICQQVGKKTRQCHP